VQLEVIKLFIVIREAFYYNIGLLDPISTIPYIDLMASWIKSDIILHIDNVYGVQAYVKLRRLFL
jgi:hypothetical protein